MNIWVNYKGLYKHETVIIILFGALEDTDNIFPRNCFIPWTYEKVPKALLAQSILSLILWTANLSLTCEESLIPRGCIT